MSAAESRTGFRLPWSSDRSHEPAAADAPAEPVAEDTHSAASGVAWPDSDFNARLGVTPTQPRPFEALAAETPSSAAGPDPDAATQEPVMLDTAPVVQAPVPPRRPTKLMADLSAAIRATADTARAETLAKVEADVAAVVAEIRAGSKEGEATLKQASDEDVVRIRDWSKAEIARIKEQAEARIEARKATLGEEIAAHAAEIERRARGVAALADAYRQDMAAYADRLAREDDPARLATMAESMPEPPVLLGVEPVEDVEVPVAELVALPAVEHAFESVIDAEVEVEASVEVEAAPDDSAVIEAMAELEVEAAPEVEAEVEAAPEAVAELDEAAAPEAVAELDEAAAPVVGVAWADEPQLGASPLSVALDAEPLFEAGLEAAVDDADAEATAIQPVEPAGDPDARPWGAPTPWGGEDMHRPSTGAGDDVPRWADDAAPLGFPEPVEGGDPVDRGAIMAALEAAAEAVVAAEAAAESADQAEAAADVAETAAELVVGRTGSGEETDPESQAAFSARVDAGGFDTESFTDRLASLMPGHEPATGEGGVRTTQVVVSGLVSVASIASFKRHLGRIGGVDAVAVASGPDGEFVFNVTHRADASFRETVPTLPGFAARVTSIGDGVITVTARDPEAES